MSKSELKTGYSILDRIEDAENLMKHALQELALVKEAVKRKTPQPKREEIKEGSCPFESKGIEPKERDYYLQRYYQGRTWEEMNQSTKNEIVDYILEGHDEQTRDIVGNFTAELMEIASGTVYTDSDTRLLFVRSIKGLSKEHLWGLVKMMRMCKSKCATAKK